MNIAGVLVHSRLEKVPQIQQQLEALPGVELHAVTDEGRMVVTMEDENEGRLADKIMKLQDIEGVISAAMVYHNFEDINSSQQEESL